MNKSREGIARLCLFLMTMFELKGVKFMTTLVLVFKKIEGKDKIKFHNFY